MADLERIYVVPLRTAYDTPRTSRSRKAVKILQGFISRHMKAEKGDISISEGVNKLIWKRGIQKPPRKIKVRAIKEEEKVKVMLLEEKPEEVKEEKAPEKKEAKKPEKKEENAASPEEKVKEEKPAEKEPEEVKKETPETGKTPKKEEPEEKPSEKKEAGEKPKGEKPPEKEAPAKEEKGGEKE
ncbi:MAG: 50S ribosomal protein L31e [Candidatus Micrarchaeia archaeon]